MGYWFLSDGVLVYLMVIDKKLHFLAKENSQSALPGIT
jgi:hypothetical protein